MIEIVDLYKRYHNHHGSDWVLKNINLTIPSGISVGLIGANGAGKSTLLNLIAGTDTPEKGKVIRHSRVSWPIGLSGGMQGSMTGRQNVKFVARAQGKKDKVTEIVDFVEDFAEIGSAFDEPVKTYSSGMRSRISFGLSLAFDFDVYISDEATAVGDRAFKAKAQNLFKQRVGKSSLIMVSHSEGMLRDLCQAGIYIRNGEAIWYDHISDAIVDYHVDTDKDILSKHVDSEIITKYGHGNKEVLSSLNYEELQDDYKKYQAVVNGLNTALRSVKADNWDKDKINLLQHIVRKNKADALFLSDKISNTREGQRKISKQQISKLNKSITVIKELLKSGNYTNEELSIMTDSLVLLRAEKKDTEIYINNL